VRGHAPKLLRQAQHPFAQDVAHHSLIHI
jgi:hypothetical protein